MTGIVPNFLLPFYNMTCLANDENVTEQVIALLSILTVSLCVMGCLGSKIICSQSQQIIQVQKDHKGFQQAMLKKLQQVVHEQNEAQAEEKETLHQFAQVRKLANRGGGSTKA